VNGVVSTPHSVRTASVVFGFATALAMWTLGFVGRLPGVAAAGSFLAPLMMLTLVGGGVVAGRRARGLARGALTGVVASLVNLLILGSLLSSGDPKRLVPSAAIWVPGSILLGAALGSAGAAIGRTIGPLRSDEPHWNGLFAKVAALATFVLVTLGGIVTSEEAGLAVTDWPNSYGYNMFLYPLSRMVGGVYYEHAHRLFGSLVGLTTVALAILLLVREPRRWVRGLGAAAVVLVIFQGILGGLRVTGHFTMSDSPEVMRPSLALAMLHGASGQIFLALVVAIAAITSRAWREVPAQSTPSAATDHALSTLLVVSVLLQLALGLRARHTGEGIMEHLSFAVVVVIFGVIVAARLLGKYDGIPVLRRTGSALIVHTGTQVALGFLAFVMVGRRGDLATPPTLEVAITTAHQACGALLLANAVLALVWCRRLLLAPRTDPVTAVGATSVD
jgi:cytochrome c oxidase assembly protein subunit 15